MLRTIEIKRFKSIVSQRVEFGRVNLFVGGNGSGKSNLLEALGVLSAALARGVTDVDLAARGVRLSTPTFFKSAFKNRALPKTFRIEASFDHNVEYGFELKASDNASHLRFNTESATLQGTRVLGRSGNGATLMGNSLQTRPSELRGLYDQIRILGNIPAAMIEQFDQFANFAIYAPQTEFLRGTEVGSAQNPPVGLHGEGLPLAVESLVSFWGSAKKPHHDWLSELFELVWATNWARSFRAGAIHPSIKSSQIKTGSETLYFIDKHMHEKRNTVTAYESSEGVLFLLFMVVMLGHPESPRIFALDNVDSGLNPRMTKYAVSKIVEVSKGSDYSLSKQVFMTSHNPTAMDAIDIFDNETRIFVVSRDLNGHSSVTRLKPQNGVSREEWVKKSSGRSLSELWIAGEIPNALGGSLI